MVCAEQCYLCNWEEYGKLLANILILLCLAIKLLKINQSSISWKSTCFLLPRQDFLTALPSDLRIIRFSSLLEKEMATHSSVLAWRIPGTGEPGGLLSMGSHRVGHDWATSLSLFTFMHWRRKWQPTPVFLPGESQGRGSLVGCCLWGCTESDMTEVT